MVFSVLGGSNLGLPLPSLLGQMSCRHSGSLRSERRNGKFGQGGPCAKRLVRDTQEWPPMGGLALRPQDSISRMRGKSFHAKRCFHGAEGPPHPRTREEYQQRNAHGNGDSDHDF